MLCREIGAVSSEIHKEQMHYVGGSCNLLMLNLVVHRPTVNSRHWGVRNNRSAMWLFVFSSSIIRFNPRGESPVPTGYAAGWYPTPVWKFSRSDKSLPLPGTNHDSSTVLRVAWSLFWLSVPWALSNITKKVKWSRYSPGVAKRVGRSIALHFHDRGTRRYQILLWW